MRNPPNFALLRTYTPNWRGMGTSLVAGLILGTIAMIEGGAFTSEPGANLPCQVQVTAEVLDVRDSPDPSGSSEAVLHRGDLRGAESTITNGYRKLADGWALDKYLRSLPGRPCTS